MSTKSRIDSGTGEYCAGPVSFGWLAALFVSLGIAAYRGFRLPNLWSVTLYNVRLVDGALRRAVVGTLFDPLWTASGHRYSAYAALAFAILCCVVVAIIAAYVGTRTSAQRVVLLAFLLAPTGGFLFHEVGYLDQIIYALLLLALLAWRRGLPVWVAVLPVALSAFVHEETLLTALPVMLWFALTEPDEGRDLRALLVPASACLAAALVPPLSGAGVAALVARLHAVLPFAFRPGAIELLGRTQAQASTAYSPLRGVVIAIPYVLAWSLFWFAGYRAGAEKTPRTVLASLGGFAAMVAPLLLAFAGYDFDRWVFLSFANAVVVLYLLFGRAQAREAKQLLVLAVVPFLLLSMAGLHYFDGIHPRKLSPASIERELAHPDFLAFPRL